MASEANCPAVSMTIRGSTVSVVRKCITSSSLSSSSLSLLFLTFTGFLMLWAARALRASTMALMVVGWMEGRIPLSSRSGSPIRFFVPDSPEVLPPVSLEVAIRSEMSMLPKSCGSLSLGSLSLSSPSEKIVSRAADKATFFVVVVVVVVIVAVVVRLEIALSVPAFLCIDRFALFGPCGRTEVNAWLGVASSARANPIVLIVVIVVPVVIVTPIAVEIQIFLYRYCLQRKERVVYNYCT
mmetsp:Transcript_20999/g.58390  ORF Transcript_20999/g.58390 Transcript_20999/m.58390 type:complete len:240 (+) Transcript_20999:824-1543(+)